MFSRWKQFWFLIFFIGMFSIDTYAQTYYTWRYREHATDCTSLTDGRPSDMCYEQSTKKLFKCEPDAGNCSGDEWKPITDGTGNTYHVATTGNDSTGTGTSVAPFATPQACADIAEPGDTCAIHEGTYGGTYQPLSITHGGEKGKPITFTNANDGEVILDAIHHIIPAGATWTPVAGATNQWKSPTVTPIGTLQGVQRISDRYWLAKTSFPNNVDAHTATEPNAPWWAYTGSNYVEVYHTSDPTTENWLITEQTASANVTNKASYITFKGLTLRRGYNGVTSAAESNYISVIGSHIYDVAQRGIISVGETPTPSYGLYVGSNIIEYAGEHGVKSGANTCPTSCPLELANFDGVVENNIIRHNGYLGVQLSVGSRNWIVRNNIFENNGRQPCGRIATSSEGCASWTAAINANYSNSVFKDNIVLSHNVLRHDVAIGYGVFFWETDEKMTLSGNIIMNSERGVIIYDNADSVTYPLNQSDMVIVNNRVINTDEYAYQINTSGIQFEGNYASNCGTGDGCLSLGARLTGGKIYRNVLVASAGEALMTVASGATYTADENQFYSPDATPFSYLGVDYDFADYKTQSSNDANSVFTEPSTATDLSPFYVDVATSRVALGNTEPAAFIDLSQTVPHANSVPNIRAFTDQEMIADLTANTGVDEVFDNKWEAVKFTVTQTSGGSGYVKMKISSTSTLTNPTNTIGLRVAADNAGTPSTTTIGAEVTVRLGQLTTAYQTIAFQGFSSSYVPGTSYWLIIHCTTECAQGATVSLDSASTGTSEYAYSSTGANGSWTLENSKKIWMRFSRSPQFQMTLEGPGSVLVGKTYTGAYGIDISSLGHSQVAGRFTAPSGRAVNGISLAGTALEGTSTHGVAVSGSGVNSGNNFLQSGSLTYPAWRSVMDVKRSLTLGAHDAFAPVMQVSSTVADTGDLFNVKKLNAERFVVNQSGNTEVGGNALIADSSSVGSEKVANGTFTGNATSWTLGSGWTYTTNTTEHASGSTSNLEQDVSAVAGEVYFVSFDITNHTLGSVTVSLGGTTGKRYYGNGTYTQRIIASNTGNLILTPTTDFIGRIDNVSVKRITGGNLQALGFIRAENFYSGDGTQGFSGDCTLSGLTTITVKDGLITACS